MAFTEFCCRSGGSNLNAGTRTGSSTEPGTAADLTYTSGSWVSSTGVFTVASGDPVADGVAVGDFASVYDDAATVTTLVGRVTARTTTTITVSTIDKSGTTTDGTNTRTLKIGGAWQGPNGTSGFPFNLTSSSLIDAAANPPRVNFKNDATYAITSAITCNTVGPVCYRGYSSSYGDSGRFTIDGGTTGASYALLTFTLNHQRLENCILQNNGATGSATGLQTSGGPARFVLRNVVVNNVRGIGINLPTAAQAVECEAYACNQSNTLGLGGFGCSTGVIERCIAHDNTGSNNSGFVAPAGGPSPTFLHCIADTNGRDGFAIDTTVGSVVMVNCDAYNNGRDGVRNNSAGNSLVRIVSCNFTKNAGWGINISSIVKTANTSIDTCGFGTGSEANTSGTITGTLYADVSGTVTYASNATPYTDPANGDFRISLAAAKGAGRGAFTQTQSGYAGTIGYPDIGAADAAASGGGVRIPNINGGADQ